MSETNTARVAEGSPDAIKHWINSEFPRLVRKKLIRTVNYVEDGTMTTVIIELELDMPEHEINDDHVYDYLSELIDDDNLCWRFARIGDV